MGLFDTSKRRQLDDLEREVLANPTPQNMVALIERYMAADAQEKAVDVARKAVEKFPNSDKVQNTYQNVRRVQLQSEITEINKSLRKSPSRAHYERLADIYHRELGNRTKAFETALEGLTKFAGSDGLHLISGQIRMDRFHQDFLANDFTEAVHHFDRASQLNSRNYKALVCLARLYAEVGAYNQALPVLEKMLRENPDDEHAQVLKDICTERQGSSVPSLDEALPDVETRRALSAEGVDVARLFEPGPRNAAAAPVVSPIKLQGFLTGYESMNGYKCSAVLTRDGACVAAHSRGMVPRESFAQFVQDVYLCSEDSSRKMDIGTFVNGEFETSVGRVALAEWKGYILGILADQPAVKKDVDAAVEKFVTFIAVG